jgi:hypothetical protein
MATKMKTTLFRDVEPCSLEKADRCFIALITEAVGTPYI